jgi:predicted TIM-barrel fold metal-dependent hydrolase
VTFDLDVIDAHHHFWNLAGSYPWLEGEGDPDRFTGDDTAIRHNYLPADFRRDFLEVKLVGSVHIDAGAGDAAAEAKWLQNLHEHQGLPSAIVAGADLLSPTAPDYLEFLSGLSAVRGVRHILNWHSDPNFTYTSRNDIITDETWLKNYALLSRYGLSFDLQVYPDQLLEGATLAARHPETPVILNHTGMPLGGTDGFATWRRGIRALAGEPNTSIKISGLGMTDHNWTIDSIRPYVLESIEAFGPDRAMFGSNFPVDSLYSTVTELYAAFDDLTADLPRAQREALFAGTAAEIYRISRNGQDNR